MTSLGKVGMSAKKKADPLSNKELAKLVVKHPEVFHEVAFIALAAGDRIRALDDLVVRQVTGKFERQATLQIQRAEVEIRLGLEMWRQKQLAARGKRSK